MKALWFRYKLKEDRIGAGWHKVADIQLDDLDSELVVITCACGIKMGIDHTALSTKFDFHTQYAKLPVGVGACKTCQAR